jgi:general secretion pathway protein M
MRIDQRYRLSRRGVTAAGLIAAVVVSLAAASLVGFRWSADLSEKLNVRESTVSELEQSQLAGISPPTLDAHKLLISGSTRGIAVAELQRIVSDVAATNDMLIDSMQALTPETHDGITAVRIEATMRGGLAGLISSIHAIETGLPLLFVSEIDIRAGMTGIDGPVEDPSSHLTVRVVVEGYLEDQT